MISFNNKKNSVLYITVLALMICTISNPALAGSAEGFGWETTLEKLTNSLQYAGYFIAIIAMVVWAAAMAFGGEMSDFGRKAVNMFLVLGLIGGGGIQVILTALGGQSALM